MRESPRDKREREITAAREAYLAERDRKAREEPDARVARRAAAEDERGSSAGTGYPRER